MISFNVALRGLVFVARAWGCERVELTAGELQAALNRAADLAANADDEPAALFFVLAKLPADLGEAWPGFPRVMARNHAVSLGLDLRATADELEALAWDVCLRGLAFKDVRAWFDARLRRE